MDLGLLNRPVATLKHNTYYRHPCPPEDFEPAITAIDRPQTLALHRLATAIIYYYYYYYY